MKVLIGANQSDLSIQRIVELAKTLSIAGIGQIIVQMVSFTGGIIVIRLLSTDEYALYTVANTMLGTMNILADGGISTGVLAEGGKVWKDTERLGVVIKTGLELRKKFALGSLVVALPVLLVLLLEHEAGWLTSIIICLSLIPAFVMALSNTLLEVALKLRQEITKLQQIQVVTSFIRIGFMGISLYSLPLSFLAILANGLPLLWSNYKLKRSVQSMANLDTKPDAAVRGRIINIVKKRLPDSIYYCLSGQITIWLVSFFGSTSNVAQIGALGRTAIIFTLFTVLSGSLILPRFARSSTDFNTVFVKYFQIKAGLLLVSGIIVLFTYLFSDEILWVLGPDYKGLNKETLLIVIGGSLNFLAGVTYHLGTTKAWVINPLISIPISMISICIGIFLFDIRTMEGILFLNIFVPTIQFFMYSVYNLRKVFSIR